MAELSKEEKKALMHTLFYTEQWLKDNLSKEKVKSVIAEMKEMGGYCDCEVLLNCYEKYDIV